MARAAILGSDRYFADWLLSELDGIFSEFLTGDGESLPSADVYFIDLDHIGEIALPRARVFTFSRKKPADFPIPTPLGSVRAACLTVASASPALSLDDGRRTATLADRTVRLSEGEYSLLSRLARAEGEFVGRDELLRSVFGNLSDPGILNVYIHYLRKKLETGDEKIIFSSRGDGYRLNRKLFGREE